MSTCRICGKPGEGQPFEKWVKDTFTNYDILHPGEIICAACLFWFDQRSAELQSRMGKDKPQKMQNYSHFVINGEWLPVSKGNKRQMAALLLNQPFPEMAAIAVSGQKHLAFRARRNPPGQAGGWVQFEEQALWVDAQALRSLLATVEQLYTTFSKEEIESGRYLNYRIIQFGLPAWQALEAVIKPLRGKPLFALAVFLAQKQEDDNGNTGNQAASSQPADGALEGSAERLQEPLSDDDLGAVRERGQERGLHGQPGPIRQLDLFEA